MKASLTHNRSRGLLTVLVCLFFIQCPSWAVDPPPPSVLAAPMDQQLRFAKKVGRESEEKRSEVAQRRYLEKKERRVAIAQGMSHELDVQREAMLSQSEQPGHFTSPAPAPARMETNSLPRKLGTLSSVIVLLLLLYGSREYIFSWWRTDDQLPD